MKYNHKITAEDLSNHANVFVESAKVGDEVLLAANDMALLGVDQHVVTESDLANNEGLTFKVGETINVESAEAYSTLEKEIEAKAKADAEEAERVSVKDEE